MKISDGKEIHTLLLGRALADRNYSLTDLSNCMYLITQNNENSLSRYGVPFIRNESGRATVVWRHQKVRVGGKDSGREVGCSLIVVCILEGIDTGMSGKSGVPDQRQAVE